MEKDIKINDPLLSFTRKIHRCPKCSGKCKRFYCRGEYGEPSGLWENDIEHFDVICQECGYKFYQRVKA